MHRQMNCTNAAMAHFIGGLTMVFALTTQMSARDLQFGSRGENGRASGLGVVIISPPVNKKEFGVLTRLWK
jgi:hypothetical protein